MNFDLSDEHLALRQMVRDFAEQEIAPVIDDYDDRKEFPYELVRKMGRMGLMGLVHPKEYGGQGRDLLSATIAVEEVARIDSGIAMPIASSNTFCGLPILWFGTEEQKRRWLVPVARGEHLSAMAITEPGAGSDVAAIQTRAVLDGDDWVINGTKEFITASGTEMTLFVNVIVVTGEGGGKKEFSHVIVPSGTPGLSVGESYLKMGIHLSDTHQLSFVDCRVPKENLLGVRGQGFKQTMLTFNPERVISAATAVGLAEGAYEAALEFAKQTIHQGEPLSHSQAVQFELVDMAMNVELSRLITYKAAVLHDQGNPSARDAASMAKLFAGEVSVRTTDEAVGIIGADSQTNRVNRMFRAAKILVIAGGTSEVQRLLLARTIGC